MAHKASSESSGCTGCLAQTCAVRRGRVPRRKETRVTLPTTGVVRALDARMGRGASQNSGKLVFPDPMKTHRTSAYERTDSMVERNLQLFPWFACALCRRTSDRSSVGRSVRDRGKSHPRGHGDVDVFGSREGRWGIRVQVGGRLCLYCGTTLECMQQGPLARRRGVCPKSMT
jgi:hypothetical protein